MGTCSRCGRQDHTEYGADGQPYCSSCIFFGINKQCWRCRMYLPATELQQYKGMWMCPYCLQDARDEDRKMTSGYGKEKGPITPHYVPETCERCGRDLGDRVYIWNGRRLCRNCLGEEQEKWGLVGGGPVGPPQKISVTLRKKGLLAIFFEKLLSSFLAIFGIRMKQPPSEIVIVEPKIPIGRAKPMSEGKMEKGEEGQAEPQSEGLMTKARKGGRKNKGASFPEYKPDEQEKGKKKKKPDAKNPFKTYKDKKKQ